jgi:NAD(P)-dependent dehydrogenase (short-subunit alcohol dehydrogenase family)
MSDSASNDNDLGKDAPAQPLLGRLAVITGASRGIGRAISIAFAQAGADLVLISRTVGGLEEVDDEVKSLGRQATLVPLDIADFEAIDRLGAHIYERWKKLDILVGNAGVLGPLTPVSHIPPNEWATLLNVNVTANARLIRSLDPLLQQSEAGRAIFLTSTVARNHRAFWGGYAASKAALEALALAYADECEKTNVRVNLVNPGATRTVMRAAAVPGEDPDTLPTPTEVARIFVELAGPLCSANGQLFNYREWAPAQDN